MKYRIGNLTHITEVGYCRIGNLTQLNSNGLAIGIYLRLLFGSGSNTVYCVSGLQVHSCTCLLLRLHVDRA